MRYVKRHYQRKITRLLAGIVIIMIILARFKDQVMAKVDLNTLVKKMGFMPASVEEVSAPTPASLIPGYNIIDPDDIKPYSNNPYVFINSGTPFFTEEELMKAQGSDFEEYGGFDALGRTKSAWMVVTHDTATNPEREDISKIYPSGWDQAKYDVIEDGWIWNRCHLLMHAAGGDDIPENLITGTRYMNTEGMWGVEQTVYYHAKENPGARVLYRVTPLYIGTELVARGVLMEAYSLEDNGKSVKFAVYCYNVQPYIGIDYKTGETWLEQ